ncbi:hypothetical protein FRC19_002670 [Serendipita sp. 401]|nr:hypothetical protein FRC19_002670 [Serendipita sp. 401]KAG9055387.1 hypothetical protein FS842_002363 [Serendipita sp. 407]
MPKRAPTPETGDDEPIYFSVVNPWPQNANMEVYGDLRLCVQWLVEALGDPNLLMAVFHKPSSPRLIIIEVNRKYGTKEYKESAEYRRILGKHSWVGPQGILENPPVGISGVNYSSIFYSCYNTGRKVEKNGWKRKWVEDDMFGTPSQRREIFKHPYPPTSFVDAPTQDQTSLQYCLNLPASEFDKNERVVKQIIATAPVGSSTWTALRGSQPPKKSQLAESDVNQIDDADVPDETTNLWAQAKDKPPIPIMSDLPMMSSAGGDGIWFVYGS